MDLTIIPAPLSGEVTPPPGKSQLHRSILAAALAKGNSVIENVILSDDINATLRCIDALGVTHSLRGTSLHISGGISPPEGSLPRFCCGESGTTLRFMIPIALAVAEGGIFTGRGRLMERPLAPYFHMFRRRGIEYDLQADTLTLRGKLAPGEYTLPGDVSSQFFSGLLFALPLLDGPSLLTPLSPPESKDYIRMTTDTLSRFGVPVTEYADPLRWHIPGGRTYLPRTLSVEADWSQAAFWYAAKELGSPLSIRGMDRRSLQGDSVFPLWMEQIRNGGKVEISAAQNPDLVPPLAARAATMDGTLLIRNISRLRWKESDRIASVTAAMAALGAHITVSDAGIAICGRDRLPGGATVDASGDHRIAMMTAIAAAHCERPVVLKGAECVTKSYPGFWEDYTKLGGIIHEYTGE